MWRSKVYSPHVWHTLRIIFKTLMHLLAKFLAFSSTHIFLRGVGSACKCFQNWCIQCRGLLAVWTKRTISCCEVVVARNWPKQRRLQLTNWQSFIALSTKEDSSGGRRRQQNYLEYSEKTESYRWLGRLQHDLLQRDLQRNNDLLG